MKHFRHLKKTEIREIYAGFLSREPKLSIARRLNIDNSTVHYHLRKIQHLPDTELIALITPTCQRCQHTSFKCLVCGTASDNIKSEEFQTIRSLREEVQGLKLQLAQYEKDISISTSTSGPIATVFC